MNFVCEKLPLKIFEVKSRKNKDLFTKNVVFAFTFAFHSVQFKFHLGLSYFKVIKYGEYYSEYKSVALRMPNAFRFSDKH